MNFQYRPEIDSLRALAVIPVILFHAGLKSFEGGYIGVDIFFVISGYLITSLILSEKSHGTFSIIKFYERRIRRLLPALFLVILITIPFSFYLLTPSALKDFGQSIIAVTSFSSNILFWRESGYFATASELKPLLHTWSLSIEAQFYILFAIFCLFIFRLKDKWILLTSFILLCLSFILANWGAINKPIANFYLFPTRLWEFMIGFFVAYYMMNFQPTRSHIKNELLSITGLLMIISSIIVYDNNTPFPSLYTVMPTIGAALLILFIQPNTYLYKLFNSRILIWIGLISYSAYLWHYPILALAKNTISEELSEYHIFIILICTLILSHLSWILVEKPFRSKELFSSSQVYKIIVSAAAILILIGSYLNITHGGLNLYTKQDQKILKNFIDPSKYVVSRFSSHELRDFESSNKKKILLIGDSFAEDLINAFYESEANNQYLSTYYLVSRCGILMVENTKIVSDQANDCSRLRNFYSFPKLLQLMSEADEVWLASTWEMWTIKFIGDSIYNISKINPNIKVFGPKYFGPVREKDFLLYGVDYWNRQNALPENFLFNKRLAELKSAVENTTATFVNLQAEICEGKFPCSPFDGNNLISYDGKHLTKYGAKKLGEMLYNKGVFN